MHLAALLGGFLVSISVQAAQPAETPDGRAAEVALSNDTLQFNFMNRGENFNYDNSRAMYGLFLSEERDIVLTGTLLVGIDPLVGRWLEIELGPRIYAALLGEENSDVFAIAVGAEVRWQLIRSRGISIAGHAYYGPDIFAFGDADSITDLGARLEMRLTENVTAFAGMRWFELDQLNRDQKTLQDELLVGARWQFR